MQYYDKKKDCNPIVTVERIKSILQNLEITTKEEIFKSSDDCFSCCIKNDDYNFSTNGKGTTLEYALASGYAEFIERLQNIIWLKSSVQIKLRYTPDTVWMREEDFLKQGRKSAKNIFRSFDNACGIHIDKKWNVRSSIKNIQKFMNRNSIPTNPAYYVNEGKVFFYPFDTLMNVGSNGMCAGNTTAEALVQGISEICERFAEKEIREKNLTPPDIPESEYMNFPEIRNMIEMYKNLGFSLHIKDASLGKNLPVVCIAFINKKQAQACLGFAAHPLLAIAIERVLTEFSQGVDWKDIYPTQNTYYELFFKRQNVFSYSERLDMFTLTSYPIYPYFFNKQKSWEHDKNTWENPEKSNKTLCKLLVNKIKSLGYDIYVRDVSFLGFPSYHVIVPQMSLDLGEYHFFNHLPKKEITKIKDIEKIGIICEYFLHPIESASLFIDKKYNQCLEKIKEHLSIEETFLDEKKQGNNDIDFLKCLKKYLELKIEKWDDETIETSLHAFYDDDLVNYLYNKWIRNDPFDNFIELIKKIEKESILRSAQKKEGTDIKLAKLVYEKYKKNIPNQIDLKDFFDELEALGNIEYSSVNDFSLSANFKVQICNKVTDEHQFGQVHRL